MPVAIGLARRYAIAVHLVRAIDYTAVLAPLSADGLMVSAPPEVYNEMVETIRSETRKYLASVVIHLENQGVTATWTVLVVVALGRRYAGRWFQVLGVVAAALVLVGVLSPLGLPMIDTANFFGYVLWSLWLIAFGVVILVHERRAASSSLSASAVAS